MFLSGSSGSGALVAALVAALLSAGLGPSLRLLPFSRSLVLGAMGAIASGVMLGAAYLIMATALDSWSQWTPVAALATVALLYATHRSLEHAPQRTSRGMALLHGIPEGVALGTALAARPAIGIWLATVVALHNLAEGAIFGERAEASGQATPLGADMLRAAADKLPQVAAALAAWATVQLWPGTSAPLFAAAFAGLVYLVVAELLMEAYHRIGRIGVALTVMAAGVMVGLLGGGA